MHVAILHNLVSPDDSVAVRDVLVQVDVTTQALESLGYTWDTMACTLDLADLQGRLERARPDVVFNLVESLGGADWLAPLVPALLDTMDIPYTGCPPEAILVTNHKVRAKQFLRWAGLPTPDWLQSDCLQAFQPDAGYVLKSARDHASLGLDEESLVSAGDAATLAALVAGQAGRIGRPCYAERFVDGREFNVSILTDGAAPRVLPLAEIDFSAFPPGKPRIVGTRAKWEAASFEFVNTPHRFDLPPDDVPLLDRIRQLTADCWRLFALAGYARVDFRVDAQGQPWILEINANPCLSPDAGFAAALTRAAIPFPQAIDRILHDAVSRVQAHAVPTEGPRSENGPL